MFRLTPHKMLQAWGFFTLLAVIAAVVHIVTADRVYFMIPATAGLLLLVLIYEHLNRRADGPGYDRVLKDERLEKIATEAVRLACYYFFVTLWALALAVDLPSFSFLRQHISMVLALVVLVGLFIYAGFFTWKKYRI